MIKALTKNQTLKFSSNLDEKIVFAKADPFCIGFMFNEKFCLLDMCMRDLTADWELIPQEVTWQEAIGAWLDGEAVVCRYKGSDITFFSGGINMALYADKEKLKYGKWYIKPMTCPLIKG